MKEEDFIRKKYGSGNPFKVPEGYFEQFTSELMSKWKLLVMCMSIRMETSKIARGSTSAPYV